MGREANVMVIACLTVLTWGAVLPAASGQDASPKKHDNAEARMLIASAEQAAAKITEKKKKVDALEDVAKPKADAGDYEGARLIARALGTDESKSKILREMALQQMLGGDVTTGVQTITGIAAADDKMLAYGEVIDELIEENKSDAALEALGHAIDVKLPDDTRAILPLLLLGRALAKIGKPEGASKLASYINEKGAPWDDIKATILAMAKAYNHNLAGARVKYAEIHIPIFKGLALETFADAQRKSGDKKGATATYKQWADLIQKALPSKTRELLDVAEAQHKNGDAAEVQATLDLALAAAHKEEDEELINLIAAKQAHTGDIEGALKTLATLKKTASQAIGKKSIAYTKAKTGDVPGALATAPADTDAYTQVEVLVGTANGILDSLKLAAKP